MYSLYLKSAVNVEVSQENCSTDSNLVSNLNSEEASASTESPTTASTQKSTAQKLAALILHCQTWGQIVEAVKQDTSSLIQATSQMTSEQRRGLAPILAAYLCQNPTALNQLAWVPSKLRDWALEMLSFTIERIGGTSILDACLETISGCKFVSVQHIGTRHEHWVFRNPLSGQNIPVDIEEIEAIALGG